VTPDEINRILTALGFAPAESAAGASRDVGDASATTFVVPTWRVDVELEEDLVEEIARHTGYDKIGSELPAATSAGEYQPTEMKCRAMRRVLPAGGFGEAI